MTTLLDTIKAQVRILDVLDWLDVDQPGPSGKISSFHRRDSDPSLHIYVDQDAWHDYGSGEGGDVIDLVVEYFGCSTQRAMQWLANQAGIDKDDLPEDIVLARPAAKPARQVVDLTDRFYDESYPIQDAHPRVLEFVKRRWPYVGENVLCCYGVRATEWALWIPHFDNDDRVVGVKVRNVNTGARHAVTGSTFTQRLYTYPADHDSDTYMSFDLPAMVVEGEPDCWAVTALSWNKQGPPVAVYGMPSGAGTWRPEWNAQLRKHRGVIVCTDNDDAGNGAAAVITNSLTKDDYFNVVRFQPPSGKDLQDSLAVDQDKTVRVLNLCLRELR